MNCSAEWDGHCYHMTTRSVIVPKLVMTPPEVAAPSWRHFETRDSGLSWADAGEVEITVRWAHGIVETGRSRVFAGYFVRVEVGNLTFSDTDQHSLRQALRVVAEQAKNEGINLRFAGLWDQFEESGLSANTGWGYIDHASLSMFEPSVDLP